ncbi:MAG: DUF951 domain-containing protein [Chloroflexi bacterium]|nr:DUF951 domain-containing protein [Chloroflexota bacterium]
MAKDRVPLITVGDLVQLRKGHPCGGDTWRVTRVGADIGVQCTTCGRRVMLDRLVFERRVRRVLERAVEAPSPQPEEDR